MKKSDYTEVFTPTSLSVLTYFMNLDSDMDRYYSVNEIQIATHASYVLLLPTLRHLAYCNILDSMSVGRRFAYRPNKDSAFLLNFKTLLAGLEEDIRRKTIQQWQT